ncbi:SpoIID/LytB domain-containing protein [Ammoniphilus sp. 3BR4]|uniref:SpoIID/LytB domain-containing protein n=1 Tax=Ammoniphilus sp. 3BR4 TaxID=3158265 RepID=UPI00346790FE
MLRKIYITHAGKWAFALLFCVSLLFPATTFASSASPEPAISVKLVKYVGNPTRLTLELGGDYLVQDASLTLPQGTYELKAENNGISLYKNGQALYSGNSNFSLQPSSTQLTLKINQRPYLGSMAFSLQNGKTIRPVNTLSIEDYVKGVIPNEMPASWNKEALKAQAVAIRTYAMRRQHQVIDDTINFQVYGGYNNLATSTQAAEETRGQVLSYRGELVETLYSSSNGGKTEASGSLWGALDYLTAKEDPYDPKKPWSVNFSKQQIDLSLLDLSQPQLWWTSTKEKDLTLMNAIKSWLQQNGWAGKEMKITSIPVIEWANVKTVGGRETKARIVIQFLTRDSLGTIQAQQLDKADLTLVELRRMFGGSHIIKSYYVNPIQDNGDTFTVSGNGFGHGVGMSQYGAKSMADQGLSMESILSFYYPGTTLSEASKAVSSAVVASAQVPATPPVAPASPATAKALVAKPKPKEVKPKVTPKPLLVASRSAGPVIQGKIKSTVLVGIRNTPSFNAKPHATLKNGQAVQVVGKKDRWLQIKTGNITGYVPDNFVQITR